MLTMFLNSALDTKVLDKYPAIIIIIYILIINVSRKLYVVSLILIESILF